MSLDLFSRVEGDSTLPDKVDVAIVGGGVIGSSAALELAERGVSVAVCEKGEIGGEQSSRNWGWVRVMGRDPAEIPLAMKSRELWRGLSARTGVDVGYKESGILYVDAKPRELEAHEAWLQKAKPFGVDSKLLSARELDALAPNAGRKFLGGLYTASDGSAEPAVATAAIARAARSRGAAILTNCAVRGIEMQGGALSGVITERGAIRCEVALLAGGAWTRLFLGNLGVEFAQLFVRSTVARIEDDRAHPEFAIGGTDFAVRKRADGGYSIAVRNGNFVPLTVDNFRLFFDYLPSLSGAWRDLKIRFGRHFFEDLAVPRRWRLDQVSPFETMRINNAAPFGGLDRKALRNLIQAYPQFANAAIAASWSGVIDVTPSGTPVIDRVDEFPGLYVASGFSGHGFGIGPAAGRLAAEMLTGGEPFADMTRFRRVVAEQAPKS